MKTKVKFLIENGLSMDTISNMNEKQINLLFEKFSKYSLRHADLTIAKAADIIRIGAGAARDIGQDNAVIPLQLGE